MFTLGREGLARVVSRWGNELVLDAEPLVHVAHGNRLERPALNFVLPVNNGALQGHCSKNKLPLQITGFVNAAGIMKADSK